MSTFTTITPGSIVGDPGSGVQARFPKFVFDADSRPSWQAVMKYAADAIAIVSRKVRAKGYDPAEVESASTNTNATEDARFVSTWIELVVCAEISTTLDQTKDPRTANNRLEQLKQLEEDFERTEDPFPSCLRSLLSETQYFYPDRVVRGKLSEI